MTLSVPDMDVRRRLIDFDIAAKVCSRRLRPRRIQICEELASQSDWHAVLLGMDIGPLQLW